MNTTRIHRRFRVARVARVALALAAVTSLLGCGTPSQPERSGNQYKGAAPWNISRVTLPSKPVS